MPRSIVGSLRSYLRGILAFLLLAGQAHGIFVQIEETTNPPGFFTKSTPTTSGSLYTSTTATKTINSYQFVYWTLNGVRQKDAAGRSTNPVIFSPTTDTALVAVYQLAAADTDGDGILDVYEQEFFGSLSQTSSSDGDADGFSLQLEILFGYHPGLLDVISEGGLSRRSSDNTNILLNPAYYEVTAVSDPAGIVVPVTQYFIGGTLATLPTPITSVINTNFVGWYDANGNRVDTAATKQPASVSVSAASIFTARYVPDTQDSDLDGLLDWFEWFSFSSLSASPNTDPDGDGLSVLMEQILSFSTFIVDIISDGGISRRSSDLVDVNIAGYYSLQTLSNPNGLQAGSLTWGAPGSSVDTPSLISSGINLNVNGYRFVGWDLDGARILDSTGAGAGKATVLLNANRTATAQFVLDTIDSDGDGIMDWMELFYYGGSLAGNTLTDADGDGYSYAMEILLGYHPRIFNLLKEGGVSRRSTDSVAPPYVILNWRPTITSQPSSATAVAGNSFSLTVVAASYSTPGYQWRRNGVNIAGATNATYSVTSASAGDTGLYDVTVTDVYGNETSTSAAVSIDGLPVVTISPVAQFAVNPSGSLTFSASALGTGPFSYQWRKDGAAISGASSATYTVLNAQASHAGAYDVVVTNSSASATSDSTLLSLNTGVSITSNPTGLTLLSGGSASFSVTATGTAPLTYQWRKDGSNISGANAPTFKLSPAATWDSGSYSVVVTNPVGSVTSGSAALAVYDPVGIATQPASITRNTGENAVLSVTATGSAPMTYQWRKNGANIAGATASSYTIANAGSGDEGSYDVVITNPAGSLTSAAAVVTVNIPLPSAVTFNQRTDGSNLVDIYYTLQGGTTSIALGVSLDGGTLFSSMASLSGDVGAAISAGTSKHIAWDAGTDSPNSATSRAKMRVTALLEGAGGTFAPIPAGTYSMGNLVGDSDLTDAGTVSVSLSSFYLAVHETTKAQWDSVRTWGAANGYTDLAVGTAKAADHPVQTVSWYDVVKWANAASEKEGMTPCYKISGGVYRTGTNSSVTCDWSANGYRLPTEAEWEVAARGGLSGKRFPWGNTISQSQANYQASNSCTYDLSGTVNDYHPAYKGGGMPYTSPPGSFVSNGYGLYDMAGNVPQWCWDWYDTSYSGGSDPRGAATGFGRALRGGGWNNGPGSARSGKRGSSLPTGTCGFRLAKARPSGAFSGALSSAGVVDTAPPVLSLAGTLRAVATSGTATTVALSGASATDTIGTPTIAYTPASGSSFTLGNTTVTATATDSKGNTTSGTFTVVVNGTISISTQPTSLTVTSGSAASFSGLATGTDPLTYQWRKNGYNLSGGDTSTLFLESVGPSDAGTYDMIASNTSGSVLSSRVTLTVLVPIGITTQPLSTAVTTGSATTLSVTATGSAPAYQWRKNGINIAGATAAAYTLANPQPADAGAYTVVVSNVLGSVVSSAASLVVNTPVSFTTQPLALTKTLGSSATFTAVATGTAPLSYQWRKDGLAITNATAASFTIPSVSAGNAGAYDVVVSNVVGPRASSLATLTVNTPVSLTTQPVSLTKLNGASASFSVLASGTSPITYQWRRGGVAIPGATAATLLFASTSASDTATYDVVVSNLVNSVTSNAVTLTVNTPLTLTSQPVAITQNINTTATFSVTATGTAPITYQWRKSGSAIAGATASSYTIASLLETHSGNYDVVITNPAGTLTSDSAALKVETPPVITSQPKNMTVTQGLPFSLSVTATDAATIGYQWRLGGVPIAGATSPNFTVSAAQSANAGSYDCVLTGAKGVVTTASVAVTVNKPIPVSITTQPASAGLREGSPYTLKVATAAGAGVMTYQWFKDNVALPGATADSFTINSLSSTTWGAYKVSITNNLGTVTSAIAQVIIVGPPVVYSEPASLVVPFGGTATVTAKVLCVSSFSYQWMRNGQPVGTSIPASGGISPVTISYTISNATLESEGLYSVRAFNAQGSVETHPAIIQLDVAFYSTRLVRAGRAFDLRKVVNYGVVDLQPKVPTNDILQTLIRTSQPAAITWSWAPLSLGTFQPIPGATSSSFNFETSGLTKKPGQFMLTVKVGSMPAKSIKFLVTSWAPAATTVTQATGGLTIVTQPQGLVLKAGGAANFGVTVSGNPTAFSWYKIDSKGTRTLLSSSSSPFLALSPVRVSDTGRYYVVCSDLLGNTIESAVVQLTIVQAGE